VHIYSDSEDVLYADHNYVALHTVRGEAKTIRLPRAADIWEVFSNRQVGRACAEFSDRMEAGRKRPTYITTALRQALDDKQRMIGAHRRAPAHSTKPTRWNTVATPV
jgi:hypothetical protein